MTYEPVDPIAFVVAFVTAPIVFTAMYFWVLFIPVFAFIGGFIPYLIIGLPLLMWHLLFHAPDEDRIGLLTMKSVAGIGALVMLASLIAGLPVLFAVSMYGTFFGLCFGPLWTVRFCRIYLRLRRPFAGMCSL